MTDKMYRRSIVWGLPVALITVAIGGAMAHLGQWLWLPGDVGTVLMVAVIVAALLSRWGWARRVLGVFVTAAFLGRAVTAMFYSDQADFSRPLAGLFIWVGIWMFAVLAVARIHYVRHSEQIVTS